MKSFVLIPLLALVAVSLGQELYTDIYDKIDLDEILTNHRLLEAYVKCVLGEGNCTPEGKELKSHIKEALENECAKCTEAQQDGTRRVIKHLVNNEPGYWEQLSKKYDPDNKYSEKYKQELTEVIAN